MTSPKRQPGPDAQPVGSPDKPADPAPANNETPSADREPRLPLERLGDLLRRTREEQRGNLQQIAEYLCIKRSFLQALEESHYDEFPADAYVVGFLRSYANYLGVDEQDAINRYRKEMAGRRRKPVLTIPTPISEGRTPSALVMAGAAAGALLIYGIWYAFSGPSPPAVSTPLLPPAELTAGDGATAVAVSSATVAPPAAATPPSSSPAPSPPVAASSAPPPVVVTPPPVAVPAPVQGTSVYGDAGKNTPVVIRAEQSSWVLISDGKGHTIFDRVLKPGEIYKVPDKEGLLLTTGNGNGIVVSLDGVELPKFAAGSSRVMRDIPLDAAHLKTMVPPPGD